MKKNVKIAVAAHKPFAGAGTLPEGYFPLQVGSEGKADLGFTRDNTGEHISGKNSSYCELTGLYWMWKNLDADVVGLCHYRRYFSHRPLDRKLHSILTKEHIERLLEKNDIILPPLEVWPLAGAITWSRSRWISCCSCSATSCSRTGCLRRKRKRPAYNADPGLSKKGKVQETQFPAGCGDGGKCVPSGHLREAQNDPQSSTETSVGYGSRLHDD